MRTSRYFVYFSRNAIDGALPPTDHRAPKRGVDFIRYISASRILILMQSSHSISATPGGEAEEGTAPCLGPVAVLSVGYFFHFTADPGGSVNRNWALSAHQRRPYGLLLVVRGASGVLRRNFGWVLLYFRHG